MSEDQLQLDKRKLLEDDINFRITSLLIVYHELSLSELTRRVRGSKSTAHRHLAVLLENGLVEVSREEKVRSDRKAKYYQLTDRAYESLGFSQSDSYEERLQATINFFLYYKTFIDEFLEFLGKGERLEQIQRYNEISNNETFDFWATLLTDDEYVELKKEMYTVFERISKKQSEGVREQLRPYFFMYNIIPFKEMLDEKNPKPKQKK
jgi:DNA-binding transcriptional ArsR family regulator